jgi:hypothetical protein
MKARTSRGDKFVAVGYYWRPLTPRRRSTIPFVPSNAAEIPKSIELERRIARLEGDLKTLLETLDAQGKRTIALQAQVDHLVARFFHV